MSYVLNLQKMVAFNDTVEGWSTASNHCSSASNGCNISGLSTLACQ